MNVLIAYATKHGSTRGIADRIAETLQAAGLDVDVRRVQDAGDLDHYDAFIIGSAVYFGSWRKEATRFVQRHRENLAGKPVWLFSSGPIGPDVVDDAGVDVRESAVPKQIAELREIIQPKDHRVFFGALDRSRFGLTERLISSLPASRELFVEGDFRDWDNITDWAETIARSLRPVPAAAG